MAEIVVGRWGKNLAVRIPRELAHKLDLHDGEHVEVEEQDGDILIRRADAAARADAFAAAEEIIAEAENHPLDDATLAELVRDGRRQ